MNVCVGVCEAVSVCVDEYEVDGVKLAVPVIVRDCEGVWVSDCDGVSVDDAVPEPD